MNLSSILNKWEFCITEANMTNSIKNQFIFQKINIHQR